MLNSFKKWLFSEENYLFEMSADELDVISNYIDEYEESKENLPFNKIFGNKSRVVIPFSNKETDDFLNYLSSLGIKPDLIVGLGTQEVKTQQGIKYREVRIGKILQDNVKKDPNAKRFLNWWEKNKDSIKNGKGVSIVVSRHPIDILRMSDHNEWTSCHSVGGSFYKCAIQEAKTGGAIAYVVSNEELKEVKNLQAKEIFKDKKRKIQGVNALERIRLRRFQDDNNDYLVPEIRTYGRRHVNFYNSIKNWALNSQKEELENVDFNSMGLKGGTYQDNNAHELWLSFYKKGPALRVDALDQEEEDKAIPFTEKRLREIVNAHKYKNIDLKAEIDEDNGLIYSATIYFEFPKKDFIKIPNEKDLNFYTKQGSFGIDLKNILDIYTMNYIDIKNESDNILFYIDVYDEEADGSENQLESFLDNLDDIEKYYEKEKNKFLFCLRNHKFIENPLDSLNLKNIEIKNPVELEFQNYYPKISGLYVITNKKNEPIVDLQGLPKSLIFVGSKGGIIERSVKHFGATILLNDDINDIIKQRLKYNKDSILDNIVINFTTDSKKWQNNLHDLKSFNPNEIYDKTIVELKIFVEFNYLNDESIKDIKLLDNNWYNIISECQAFFYDRKKNILELEKTHDPHESKSNKIIMDHIKTYIENYFSRAGVVSIVNNAFYWKDNQIQKPMPVKDFISKYEKDTEKGQILLNSLSNYTINISKLFHNIISWRIHFEYDSNGNPIYYFKYSTKDGIELYDDVVKALNKKLQEN